MLLSCENLNTVIHMQLMVFQLTTDSQFQRLDSVTFQNSLCTTVEQHIRFTKEQESVLTIHWFVIILSRDLEKKEQSIGRPMQPFTSPIYNFFFAWESEENAVPCIPDAFPTPRGTDPAGKKRH